MEYRAALCIQSWFRGCRVRAYFSHLHAQAIIIQRNFRGHLGREEYRSRLEGGREGGEDGVEGNGGRGREEGREEMEGGTEGGQWKGYWELMCLLSRTLWIT